MVELTENEVERLIHAVDAATKEFTSLKEELAETQTAVEDERSARTWQMRLLGLVVVLSLIMTSFGFYLRHESCLRSQESRDSLRGSLALIVEYAVGDDPTPSQIEVVEAFEADIDRLFPPISCEFPQ